MILDRQGSNAWATGIVNSVDQGRRDRGNHAFTQSPPRRFSTEHPMRFDLWHLIEAQHSIVIEVSLHYCAPVDCDFPIKSRGEAERD